MKEQKTTKRRLPAIIRWILWVLLVQFILINTCAAFYAYRLTHFYNDRSLFTTTSTGNIFSKTWKLFTGPKQPKSFIRERPTYHYDTVLLKTRDGMTIDTWYAAADTAAKGTVIFFHGITTSKSNLLDEAYEFRYWGYNIMLVDLRGHGNSSGNTTTIGYRESEEVKLAYDYIAQKGEKSIFLYGVSLGSVVITKAIADFGIKPSGVILDMPFASLQSYLKNKARTLGFPRQPFAFLTTFWIGAERGFNGYKHKTATYAKKITCPVLMQWGAADIFVLKDETEEIYSSIATPDKKLVVYESGQHGSFLRAERLKWRAEVESFLVRCSVKESN